MDTNATETRLFAYGTLTVPRVAHLVLERFPDTTAATLEGYQRVRIAGVPYPTIVRCDGSSVEGLLLHGIGRADWQRLDQFEDDVFYQRQAVCIVSRGQPVQALAYVSDRDALPPGSGGVWDRRWLESAGFDEWLDRLKNNGV